MAATEEEALLRASLLLKGEDDLSIDDAIFAIRGAPNRYRDRQNEQGAFARALLAAIVVIAPIVAIVPMVTGPPLPSRDPSVINLDLLSLSEHKAFKELGPVVKHDAPANHFYSHMNIDHTVSGFAVGSQEEKAVLLVYRHLMYESKPFPCKEVPGLGNHNTRGPFFTIREHNHQPPLEREAHREVLIYGSTQLSKTPEAAASAWCAFFIDGCVPIIGVRNKGGANTGSTDMADGLQNLNKRVEELFRWEVQSGNLALPEADSTKLRLTPRKTSDNEQLEFDVNSLKLAWPQALVICMNPGQVKNLIGDKGSKATSKAGAAGGLFDIMKGNTNHPYPPKCDDPYKPFDCGTNRPVARIYFILDEDDLNRSNTSTVTERLQFQAPPDVMKRIEKGLDELLISARARQSQVAAAAAQGTLNDPVLMDDDDSMLPDDDDDDDELEGAIVCADKRNEEARDDTRMRNEFKSQMEATGIRSAVRGVVALTATPAACGHDLSAAASKVMHHVCAMEHPGNYVGYEFTAAPYAERKIKHEPVPDRKQITAIKKGLLYPEVLKRNSWWDTAHDQPMPPFRRRADGAIVVFKRDLTDIEEGNDKSSTEIKALVDTAYRESARRGDKVLESDGVGIALMLEAMSELSANQEPERRALIVSNYTRTNDGKLKLARHILNGELTLEDGRQLPENCVSDIFVIIFDHKVLRIMWRGPTGDGDATIESEHDSRRVLNAIAEASNMLYEGCVTANKKTGTDPQIQNDGASGCMVFATSFVNINHAYTALLLYARQRRLLNGVPFKLKTVALAGDLGGRGVNFKPHSKGFGYNPAHGGSYLVDPHQGYLTDMFFMFDAVKNRQITTHGEFVLQAIGRLCTIVKDDQLTMMARTPPRLWTSLSCYNIISTFARGVQQWVSVMQSKAPGESMAAAVLRSIQAEPERLAALYKIYVLPTTDSRWAKKELWLRTTRLVNSDRNLGEIIRTAPLRSPVALNHGIGHDPETDQWNHMQKAIGMAEVEVAQRKANGQDVDDGMQGAAGSSRDPPRRNVRRRIDPAVMQAKFLRIYEDHPDLAKTTGPTPQNMPSYDDLIYVKWSDWHRFPHYPAKVVNIRIVEEDGDCFQTVYTIRFTTDDAMNSLAESEQFVHDNQRLDPDMAEWQYINPNT